MALTEVILNSDRVPSIIKEEIMKELDFESKYGYPVYPYFLSFLSIVMDYFQVSTESSSIFRATGISLVLRHQIVFSKPLPKVLREHCLVFEPIFRGKHKSIVHF